MRDRLNTCIFELDRMSNQCIWFQVLPDELASGEHYFENEIFVIRPYYWGEGEDVEERNSWHFWHKPSGFKISWYKYPLRGAGCNIQISAEEFYAIVQDCANSLPNAVFHDCKPWWLTTKWTDESDNSKQEGFDVAGYIEEHGYEDVVIFDNPSYNNAFIGITTDFRAVYDYDKMVECLLEEYPEWTEEEALDFIEYNTIRATGYIKNSPIIMISKEE